MRFIVSGKARIVLSGPVMANPGSHELHARIYEITKLIPRGRVATYGQVAALAGLPGHARLAGYALYNLPSQLHGKVPWQRVLNARGEISYSESRQGNDVLQRELLEKEGVEFDARGRIDMQRYRWDPDPSVWMDEREG
jgi:methylated-DNA-protein-cysteine methyltransferase-like protein